MMKKRKMIRFFLIFQKTKNYTCVHLLHVFVYQSATNSNTVDHTPHTKKENSPGVRDTSSSKEIRDFTAIIKREYFFSFSVRKHVS